MKVQVQSVRVRATLGASLVVLVALLVAGVALATTLRSARLGSIDTSLELRAVDIESLLDGGASPASVAIESDEAGLVQIADGSGRIVSASENLDGEPLVTSRTGESTRTEEVAALSDERFRIHVHPTDSAADFTIIVGTTLDDLERDQRVLLGALLVGVPALMVVMVAMVWFVVGRALRPVDAIRAQVAAIGGKQLDHRVPVPAANDEIGRLAVTMNAMLDRLEDSSNRQARFVSDASHELRTPIAVIRHEAEVALAAADHDGWRETARDILDEDLRMQRLVDDLLFIARHERPGSGETGSGGSLIDLDDLVLAEVARGPSPKTIDVTGVSAGQVRGNADHLGRVVRNLLDNAMRHAVAAVALHVSSEDGFVVLDVDDDGPGVRDDLRERIFERFARADDARTREDGGSGLGLAIVLEIVTDHGGTVSVQRSAWLGGARFTVKLPDARA